MIVEVLGSGTSTGVPVPGCPCAVCCSDAPRNKRLRTSVHVAIAEDEPTGPRSQPLSILIDTSPDLRYQSLRSGITRIDAVLYTHSHADHIFGLDDLRSFNFINGGAIDIYADEATAEDLCRRFDYAFRENPHYEGGSTPHLRLHLVRPYEPLVVGGVTVLPLKLFHGSMPILGYRIGKFAYLTDCSKIPDETREQLGDLDLLIIDGLRRRPHKTHFTHEQAVQEIERLKPVQSYLTHVSHEIDHDDANRALKSMTSLHVELAYDGLRCDVRL